MGNKLSFLNALFILMLIGKIGHIGTLANASWPIVIALLVADVILDFCVRVGWIDRIVYKIRLKLELNKIKKDLKK